MLNAFAAPESIPEPWQPTYDSGVEHYRNGEYEKAFQYFKQIAKGVPESQEGSYYYAITLAQLGRFKEAKSAYEKAIRLAPESEAAMLARQGIEYLPQPEQLDRPPQFRSRAEESMPIPSEATEGNHGDASASSQAIQTPFGNMDPQMLQMMMLMGSMGGGSGGGINSMMMYPMMQSMMRGNGENREGFPGEESGLSPNAFSTMMMNQLMQDFSPFSSSDKDD